MGVRWPGWAAEPIEIVQADPAWAQRAALLAADVQNRIGVLLVGDVEHVGSTAVPGLAAKPVIDLMAPVGRRGAADADAPLAASAWQLVPPDLDARPWRRSYVLAEGSRRLAHLHLVAHDHERWRLTLAFRDILRARPALADQYAALKRRLATIHRDDREAYSAAKAAFIDRVVRAEDAHRGS